MKPKHQNPYGTAPGILFLATMDGYDIYRRDEPFGYYSASDDGHDTEIVLYGDGRRCTAYYVNVPESVYTYCELHHKLMS